MSYRERLVISTANKVKQFRVTKPQAIDLEIKLNLIGQSVSFKSYGDRLYNFGVGK